MTWPFHHQGHEDYQERPEVLLVFFVVNRSRRDPLLRRRNLASQVCVGGSAQNLLAANAVDLRKRLGDGGSKRRDRARLRRALVASGGGQFLDAPGGARDAPGADGEGRAAQGVGDFRLRRQRQRGWAGELSRQSRRLRPEEPEQFGFELRIAKALAGQMNEIERRIEGVGRTVEHSALSFRPEARGSWAGAVNR